MRILLLLVIIFTCVGCTNDDVIRGNKASFTKVYSNILSRSFDIQREKSAASDTIYDREWLSKFTQPIIGISAPKRSEQAALVALGNQDEKLTWVSADGISVSFANGILIATRGYSQDLMESRHGDQFSLFTRNTKKHFKTHRYLDGQNGYIELNFSCSFKSINNNVSYLLDIKLKTTKFTESCTAGTFRHINEYHVLPKTNIVIKSKQWVSESNGYILVYNYYAFQNNLF